MYFNILKYFLIEWIDRMECLDEWIEQRNRTNIPNETTQNGNNILHLSSKVNILIVTF